MRQLLVWALAFVVVPLAAIGIYLGYLQISGNFHTVTPNQLYRSAQPTAAELKDYAKRYGIRTVLNLRGEHPNASWYEDEVSESRLLGIGHIDFRMSASKELSKAEIERLVTILQQAPKPMLIHCQSGADRSGLVAAIFLNRINGVDLESAEGQISLYYGHIGVPYLSSTYAMDRNWERLESLWKEAKASR